MCPARVTSGPNHPQPLSVAAVIPTATHVRWLLLQAFQQNRQQTTVLRICCCKPLRVLRVGQMMFTRLAVESFDSTRARREMSTASDFAWRSSALKSWKNSFVLGTTDVWSVV